MGLVSAWFGARRRGLATGIVVSGSSFAMIIAGAVIPPLMSGYGTEGWRYSWYLLAALSLVIAAVAFIFLRNRPEEKGMAPIGAAPQEAGRTKSKASALQWSLIYKTPAVWHLALIYVAFGFSYIIYATFFARYLVGEAGFTMAAAGTLWSSIGAVSIASGFIWGSVSDLLGRKYGLAIVYFLQALCFSVFGLWKAPAGYYLSAGLFALTAWSIPAIMAAAAGDHLGARLAPAALGFVTFFFGIGQALGPFTAGRIASATGTYSAAFVLAGGVALSGGLASLFLSDKRAHQS
jgi:sugar phosphate permease